MNVGTYVHVHIRMYVCTFILYIQIYSIRTYPLRVKAYDVWYLGQGRVATVGRWLPYMVAAVGRLSCVVRLESD